MDAQKLSQQIAPTPQNPAQSAYQMHSTEMYAPGADLPNLQKPIPPSQREYQPVLPEPNTLQYNAYGGTLPYAGHETTIPIQLTHDDIAIPQILNLSGAPGQKRGGE